MHKAIELEALKLIAQLKRARGREFVRLFRQADATIGERLRQQINDLKERQGKVSVLDVAKLALAHDLPLKTTFRMLEGAVLPTGTYERLVDRGLQVNQVFEVARQELRKHGEGDRPLVFAHNQQPVHKEGCV